MIRLNKVVSGMSNLKVVRNLGICGVTLVCAAALTGCKEQSVSAVQIPRVTTVSLAPETVILSSNLPGRTNPYRIAEIRPQVSGVILKRLFTEGGDVKEGESLYQIDPAPFEAALNSAKDCLERAEASLPASQLRMERYKEALKLNAVSQQEYDDAEASVNQILADISYYKAQVVNAQINVDYSKVISPISGRIGVSSVTEGAVVSAYPAEPLATVQQLDPIYVDVPQAATEVLQLQSKLKEGKIHLDSDTINKVTLMLDDGSEYEHEGTFQFRDVTVDPSTSTMTLRMIFPNPDGKLLPGMFVRAIVEEGTDKSALLLPQETVVRDRKGNAYVWTVASEGTVKRVFVDLDRAIGNKWLVKSGLKGDEHIVFKGIQSIRSEETKVQEDYAGDYTDAMLNIDPDSLSAENQAAEEPPHVVPEETGKEEINN